MFASVSKNLPTVYVHMRTPTTSSTVRSECQSCLIPSDSMIWQFPQSLTASSQFKTCTKLYMKFAERIWGLRVRRSKLLVRNDSFLEAFRDGRRSGGRQPALRRPGALRRRTTGSPTADSFISHVQYLIRDRSFFLRRRE